MRINDHFLILFKAQEVPRHFLVIRLLDVQEVFNFYVAPLVSYCPTDSLTPQIIISVPPLLRFPSSAVVVYHSPVLDLYVTLSRTSGDPTR